MNTLLDFNTIRALTRGQWISQPLDLTKTVRGGAFDTRNLGDAQIFFAWKGDSADGHVYLPQLESSQIQLIVVERDVPPVGDKAILKVDDSLAALHKMAAGLISGFQGKTVNITGSSGKTTSKAWLNHLVNGHRRVLTNAGSFNNHIGCPITILNMARDHELLILEMGTSGLGEIEKLTAIAPADIALLLNVGHAHLGKFGSIDKIYQAKLELFSHLNPQAIALLPYADKRLRDLRITGKQVYFGQAAPEFSWKRVAIDPDQRTQTLQFHSPFGSREVTVPCLADYAGDLLCGIIAVCYHLGLDWEQLKPGFATLPQEKGRSTFVRGMHDVLILDDTYNANPESVIAMLKTVCSLEMPRRVGVVGNMAELDEGLQESGEYLLQHLPEQLTDLFLCGETGKILYPQIVEKFPRINTRYAASFSELMDMLSPLADARTVVGVKGSRSSHMERVVYALQGRYSRCHLQRCGKLMMCKQCDQL